VRKKDIVSDIGLIIRELRIKKGLSQEDLSYKSNIHRTYIGTIERAEKVASIITLEKIAIALDIRLSDIFQTYESRKQE